MKLLQQAAIIHDRGVARKPWDKGGNHGGKWKQHAVHVTEAVEELWSDEDLGQEQAEDSDAELVEEEVASGLHSAYMAFQDAKSRYREALKGRGMDRDELKKRSEERLKLAKSRSYCAACKRKGHWHRDPECPRGAGKGASAEATKSAHVATNYVQMCYMVDNDITPDSSATAIKETTAAIHTVFMAGNRRWTDEDTALGEAGASGDMLAIADTACSKTVAGHDWYESYCAWADRVGLAVDLVDECDSFKFGVSRIHQSIFAVWALFGIKGRCVKIKVAVVQCRVPLLLSRNVLGKLGMVYRVEDQTADFAVLRLNNVALRLSETGHPALEVLDFVAGLPSTRAHWTVDPEVRLCDDRESAEQ